MTLTGFITAGGLKQKGKTPSTTANQNTYCENMKNGNQKHTFKPITVYQSDFSKWIQAWIIRQTWQM